MARGRGRVLVLSSSLTRFEGQDADMDLAWHALCCRVGSFLPGWFLSASMCTSLILQQFPATCDLVDRCGVEAILWVWEYLGCS